MYKQYYLMQKDPFGSHPSPEIYYNSMGHQNGWRYLLDGIKREDPLLLVTGEYGAGKTLLCLKLLQKLQHENQTPFVFVPGPGLSFSAILTRILKSLKRHPEEMNEAQLQAALFNYFEGSPDIPHRHVYIVLDDTQEFSVEFLNKIKSLASYNSMGHFPFRIIMFAHKSIRQMLTRSLIPLRQRIKRIYELPPLGVSDTKEYIYFRLIYSGASGKPVFNDDAISLLNTITRGIPRLINNACDGCLLMAAQHRLNHIDKALVERWARTMKEDSPPSPEISRRLEPRNPMPDESPIEAVRPAPGRLAATAAPVQETEPVGRRGIRQQSLSSGEAKSEFTEVSKREIFSKGSRRNLASKFNFSDLKNNLILLLLLLLCIALFYVLTHGENETIKPLYGALHAQSETVNADSNHDPASPVHHDILSSNTQYRPLVSMIEKE